MLVGEMLQVVGLNAVIVKIGAKVTHGIILPSSDRIGQQSVRVEKERVRRGLIVIIVLRAMFVIHGKQIVRRSIVIDFA